MGKYKPAAMLLEEGAQFVGKHLLGNKAAQEGVQKAALSLDQIITSPQAAKIMDERSLKHAGSFTPNRKAIIQSGDFQRYYDSLPENWKHNFQKYNNELPGPDEQADFHDLLLRAAADEAPAKGAVTQAARTLEAERLAQSQQTRLQNVGKPPEPVETPPPLIEVGGVEFDYNNLPPDFNMKGAEELYQRPEIKQAFDRKAANVQTKTERVRQVEAKTEADYPEGKFHRKVGDVGDSIRTLRDAQAGADPAMTRDILGVQAEQGYGVAKGKTAKTAHREGALGFKPDNKGRLMNIEQHHAAFPNAEGSALMDQQAITTNPVFELALHRYIAQKYDAALAAAAKNMANLPYDVHQEMLHRWLEQFDLEDYWRLKLKENPNMSPRDIVLSIDEYFAEIVYPTMNMLDTWMAKSDLSKVNVKDIRIPKTLTAKAKKYIKDAINQKAVNPTAKLGTTAHDVQVDKIMDKVGGSAWKGADKLP